MGILGSANFETGVDTAQPLKTVYHSHDTIVARLHALAALPDLVPQAEQCRQLSAQTLALFEDEVLRHHADEERDLFPGVVRSAEPGEERARVEWMTELLVAEHRVLESLWHELEPSVRAAAKGRAATIDARLVSRLVRQYARHARFEELHFLPLAQTILARNANHLDAVGMGFHMRRLPDLPGYI